jgi:predicted nuclease of predicted toxin-antitoxin system
MRLKVDENVPREACDLLNRAGHDAISVGQQGIGCGGDARLYRLCQDERRALVTLDVDFANVRAYDPKSSPGIIGLRLARQDKQRALDAVASTLGGPGTRAAGEAAVDRRGSADQDPRMMSRRRAHAIEVATPREDLRENA